MNDLFPDTDLKRTAETALTHAEIAVVALKRGASPATLKIAKGHLESALKAITGASSQKKFALNTQQKDELATV